MKKLTILLTGAAGYIGSHTWIELLAAQHNVIGLDNFINSRPTVIDRIEKISGRKLTFIEGDVRDSATLDQLFTHHRIDAVVHFAALKAVGESVSQPLGYYENNLGGLISLCKAMQKHDVKTLAFSSSATVYGNPASVPIFEDFPLSATNPYGQTKLMSEQILRDLEKSDAQWKIGYLRYFNPVGAHESGDIGEDPGGIPNNLMPYIAQVAGGRRAKVSVFGSDYDTPDGSGVRDYIHVVDLARAHVLALEYLAQKQRSLTVNIGTGVGYSVIDVINAYRAASGQPIPYDLAPRRPGDIGSCYADPTLAWQTLQWKAEKNLDDMCRDSWRWQMQNPEGYV